MLFFVSNILINYLEDVLFSFLIRCCRSWLSILVIELLGVKWAMELSFGVEKLFFKKPMHLVLYLLKVLAYTDCIFVASVVYYLQLLHYEGFLYLSSAVQVLSIFTGRGVSYKFPPQVLYLPFLL